MRPFARPAVAAAARRWALWLALALVAAQSLAAWHVYSHSPQPRDERATKNGQPATDTCVLCLATVGLGGAPGTAPAWKLAALPPSGPVCVPVPAAQPGPVARPYAIRAPPLLAS